VTTELADDAARGNVPVENLPVGATGHQLRVIPAQKPTVKRRNSKKHSANFPLLRLQISWDAMKGDRER